MRIHFILIFLCSLFIATNAVAQKRIITAGSSSTEIVNILGLGDNIVATDRTSLYPERMQALPSIGYRTGIAAEGIIALTPDLVIFESEYVKDEVVTQITSTGVKVLVVDHKQNIESTHARVRSIGNALNKKAEAEQLIKKIDTELAEVKRKVDATRSRPTVLCVYARGTGSMQVAGKNTSFGLLSLAGVVNAVSDIEGYKPLNTEALIHANPDYILFFTTGLESVGGVDGALKIPGVAQTTAGKKKQIIAMDGVLLTNWGPRVSQAADDLFTLTHPQARE